MINGCVICRTGTVQMPYDETPLPERVEKQRPQGDSRFDLETANLSDVFRHKNKNKSKKKNAKPDEATTETTDTEIDKE